MNRREFLEVGSAATLLGSTELAAGEPEPDAERAAGNYRVKTYSQFARLAPGSIAPTGWLLDFAQINADAWLLDYARHRDPGVYSEYSRKSVTPHPIFNDNNETIDFCGYIAYFGSALIHYAELFPQSKVAAEVVPWVKSVLASQDPDGYLGGFAPEARWQHWLEIWALALVLDALLFRYEATGDQPLLVASERALQVVMKAWRQPPPNFNAATFSGEGIFLVGTASKLYGFTGKKQYLTFAREVLNRCGKAQAYLHKDDAVVYEHAVIASDDIPAPATLFEFAGDPELLKASEAGWKMMQPYLSVDGSPQGNEMIFHTGSRANSEHCGAVNWMAASQILMRMTADAKYADATERAFFNGYPAPKSPDGKMVGYMHSPNQLVASEWSNPHENDGDVDWWASRQHFSSAHEPLCCNSNGPRGIPFYVESMVLRTEDGLAVACYGPCELAATVPQAGRVSLRLDTAYPFEDDVRISIDPEHAAQFALKFRIPGWCVGAKVELNGVPAGPEPKPGTFLKIERHWQPGDKVTLRFQNQVRLVWRRRPEFRIRARCAAIVRGPLTFVLPVAEDWQPFVAPAHGPGQGIESCRILPREGAVWNYALVIDQDHPGQSLTLRKLPVPRASQPFGPHSPIGLEVKARRVLNWKMEGDPEHPKTPGFPFNPMQLADQVETVTLVPFGATRLRMAFLPVISG